MSKVDIDATRLARAMGDGIQIEGLQRLSGGASQETWAFDQLDGRRRKALILRRSVGGRGSAMMGAASISLATEAELIRAAAVAGVPVPRVRRVLTEEDGLGEGFVMERVSGETIPRKILRDQIFAEARPRMARQCGEIAARIHRIPVASLPPLPRAGSSEQWKQYRSIYDAFDVPHPVFELAFRWLERHAPGEPIGDDRLVHGDFRNGNLMVSPDGVAAVLDWELAHLGDPMEDLGWICVNSWRFGEVDLPVGGFGSREDLFAGYQSISGIGVDPERVHYWEVFGTLKWGIMCLVMYGIFRSGLDRSVERAAIGRRASETEFDLLNLLAAPAPAGAATEAELNSTHQQPTAVELVEAVRSFLEDKASPELKGRTAFHARVAVNALAIVARELAFAPAAAKAELARLRALLRPAPKATADELNRELCRRIRAGEIALDERAVLDHLWLTTMAKLAIDQPKYEAYRRLIE